MRIRALLSLVILLLAAPASARADEDSATDVASPDPRLPKATLWQRIVDPHGPEIAAVLYHARALHQRAREIDAGTHTGYHPIRRRLLEDARGMLRYALRLSPDHLDVIALLADVEDTAGQPAAAIRGYREYMERTEDRHLSRARCLRFGVLLARTGQDRQAARALQRCIDLPYLPHIELKEHHRSRAIAARAMVLAHDDRLDDAFALLHRNLEVERDQLVAFTLAVLYDQDEQITRAYEILEQDFNAMHDELTFQAVAQRLQVQPFLPAAERHYYLALLYESRGLLADARNEWLAYVHSSALVRYHRRARKHIRDVDRLLEQRHRDGTDSPRPTARPPP